jgi:type I restriction enzyme S subunit
VPLPPAAEQSVIIDELTRQLSVVDVLHGELEANILRADRLRQSVLGKAFSGELNLD